MKLDLKMKLVKVAAAVLSGAVTVITFQNCSGNGFSVDKDFLGQASLGSSSLTIPQVSLVAPIPTLSNSRSLTVNINVITDSQASLKSVSCQLDSAPAIDCTTRQLNLSNLTDGDHSLKITATDDKGNSAQERIFNFRIDGTAPVVNISQSPATLTGSTSAEITFTAMDSLSTIGSVMCSRDNGAWAVCTSPTNLTGLVAGMHSFKVRATDTAGNTSAESMVMWTVDLSAPIMTITAKPNAFSNSKVATFSFEGSTSGVALPSYECSQDGGAYAACASPKVLNALSEGNHSFAVRGINSVGTRSAPITATWAVDTIAPSTPVLSANVTSPTLQTTASISFTATDSGSMVASYQCSLDSAVFAACISPSALASLSEGAHVFQVRAIDFAGNNSAIGSFNWTVNFMPTVYDGVALYAANCAGCHGALASSSKINRTAAQIQASITNVASMNFLRTLQPGAVDAIAKALVKTSSGLANPFACTPGDTGVSVLRRLTKREYINTILDLFQGQLSYADISVTLADLQPEFTNKLPSVRVFDSTNPNSMSRQLLDAYIDLSTRAADVITANPTKMNAIGGSCISAATVTTDCVSSFLDSFGMRALRRPLTATEKTTFMTLYNSGTSSPDRMARVVQALILAPQFLYKMEDNGTSVNGRADLFQLNSYEIASRLSFGIMGSMPDQELFEAARLGSLNNATGLQTQVERLFTLSKARDGVRAFYSQWLRLDYLPDITVSAAEANGLNLANFKNESRQEVIDLMDHLIWTQRSNYKDLMTTSLAIPKGANIASVYGIAPSSVPVTLASPARKGLLTRVGMLALDSTGRSNPIKRGVHARIHMLCDPMGAPPADTVNEETPFDPLASTRDQVAAKTSAPQCMACHSRINPAGFAFENFDGLGRYRLNETVSFNGTDRNHPINSTVSPNINTLNDLPVSGAAAFQTAMAESPAGQACFAKQWLQYNTGRDAIASDGCALSTMYDAVNKSGGSMLEMLKAYTKAPDFLLKKLGPLN